MFEHVERISDEKFVKMAYMAALEGKGDTTWVV